MATRYNVVTKRSYESKGEEKTQWNNVGSLVHFPARDDKEEGFALELSMYPATKFYIFAAKKKEDGQKAESDPDNITL